MCEREREKRIGKEMGGGERIGCHHGDDDNK